MRRTVWLLAATLGCAEPEESAAPRFYVQSVEPADGGLADVELALVLLHFNGIPDLSRCTIDTMRVDAARDDDTIAFGAPIDVVMSGQGTVKLRPLEPYLHGWSYVVTVRGGETGCADEDGVAVEPFESHFEVP